MLFRLLTTATLMAAFGASALGQTQKGQSFYSGTFSFSKTSEDQADQNGIVRNSTRADIDLAARAGFFVKNNLALGLGLSQQWRGSNDAGFAVRPFIRYHRPLGAKFSVFLQGEIFYKTRNKFQFITDPRYGINGGLGVVYFANRRLAIEASMNLLSLAVARASNDFARGTSVNVGANLNANVLGLSLAYYVGASTPRRSPNPENTLSRGTRFLGGSVDAGGSTTVIGGNAYGSSSVQDVNGFNLNLRPQMGWFVRDHVAVGVGLNVGLGWMKYETSVFTASPGQNPYTSQNSLSLGIRPFVRNYAMLGPKAGVFLESSLNLGFSRQNVESKDYVGVTAELNSHSFFVQAGIRPGVTYFLGRRFAVEATTGFVGFNLSNSRYPTNTSQGVRELKANTFSFSPTWAVGSDLGVGLKYYIR